MYKFKTSLRYSRQFSIGLRRRISDLKMPKPRSPEFKEVASRRPQSKKTKESNDKWTPSDEEHPISDRDPIHRVQASLQKVPLHEKPERVLRSPAAELGRKSSRGSNGPRPSQRSHLTERCAAPRQSFAEIEKVSPSVVARDVQSDYEEWTGFVAPVAASRPEPKTVNELNPQQTGQDSYPRKYPEAIANLIELSLMEADQVREAFKGRRQNYVRIFQAYKDKLADRDYSIIRGATGYLYENSRIKSINEETALWMLGIYEIPASQIQSYTSKAVLEKIAKNCGLSSSGKKAEVLIKNIRSVIDSSK